MIRPSPRLIARILLVAVIVALLVLGLHHGLTLAALQHSLQTLQSRSVAHPLTFAAAFFGFYVLAVAVSLPFAELLTLAAGALFGVLEGTLLASFASTLGATLAMLASRFLFRDWLRRHAGKHLQHIDRGLARDGAFYLFELRLVPLVPYFLINLLVGLTPIRIGTYWWVSQLGMLPGTLVYTYAGTRLAAISSLRDLLSPGLIAAFVLLALLPWLLRGVLALIRKQ